jgi:hypothetical protein
MQRRSWTALRRLRTLSSGPSDLDVAVGLQVGQEPLGFPLKLAEVHLGHVASVLEQLLWTRFCRSWEHSGDLLMLRSLVNGLRNKRCV